MGCTRPPLPYKLKKWKPNIQNELSFARTANRGYPIQSPYVAIANRQAELMLRIAAEFGFTPASRGRISTPGQKQASLFDVLEEEDTNDA